MLFSFRMSFIFSCVDPLSCTFRQSHQTNSLRACITPRKAFFHCPLGSQSPEVTPASENSWASYASGIFQAWLALYTMICLCQGVARALPQCHQESRIQEGRQWGNVAQRDKEFFSQPSPINTLYTETFDTSSDWSSQGNLLESSVFLIWQGMGTKREAFHLQHQCLNVLNIRQTHLDGFLYSLIHSLTCSNIH